MATQEDALVPSERRAIQQGTHGSIRDEVQDVLKGNFVFAGAAASQGEVFDSHGYLLGGLALMARNHTPHSLVRGRDQIRSTQLDHYGVLMATTPGGIDMDFEGRRLHVEGGQPVLVDMARVGTGHYGAGRDIAVFLPRDALDALLPRALDLHGVLLRGGAGQIFSEYLHSLAKSAPLMRQRDGGHATVATLHLLAAALAPSFESLGLAMPTIDQALHRKAQRFIEANLSNPDLGATHLCAELNVSRSTIYRVFEPYQGIKSYINERRLTHCHAAIAGATQRVYMAQMAERFGFRNNSDLSRAFRRHFGYTPSEVQSGAPASSAATPNLSSSTEAFAWPEQTRQWSASRT